MLMLWISCLLIGSINCSPIQKEATDSAATSSMPQLFPHFFWPWAGGPSSDPGSSSPLPIPFYLSSDKATELPAQDAISSAGPGSYSSSPDVYSSNTNMAEDNEFDNGYASLGDKGYNSPEVSEYGVAYAASESTGYDSSAPGGSYDGYGSSASAYVGGGSYGFAAPQDENWSSGSTNGYGAGDKNPEPVFSVVSDLEPVYSFGSRSSYQRGRAVFTQTRYTPGEPVPPLMPVSRRISKTSKQSAPAKAPTKGGF